MDCARFEAHVETQERDIFDITILGGGPVGLFGLFYAGLRGLRAKLIDEPGGVAEGNSLPSPRKNTSTMWLVIQSVLAKDLVKSCVERGLMVQPSVVCLEEEDAQSICYLATASSAAVRTAHG